MFALEKYNFKWISGLWVLLFLKANFLEKSKITLEPESTNGNNSGANLPFYLLQRAKLTLLSRLQRNCCHGYE